MPFKSKAQQRFMFSQHPRMAKRWAGETKDIESLLEKLNPEESIPKSERKKHKMTKQAADGMFFEKRSQPRRGRFFRDMPARDDANFHEKSAFTSYAQGQIPQGGGINVGSGGSGGGGMSYGTGLGSKPESLNIGATGAPVGGSGQRGEGMGGGLYGTGKGEKKSDETKARESDMDRLQDLLANAAGGKEKTAGKTPNDWDADSGLPTGFHRPAYEQPEALEAGGERFHSTEAKSPNYGAGHGLVEGGKMHIPKGTGHQMGKHASATPDVARFMGTSFALEKSAGLTGSPYERQGKDYAKSTGEKFVGSLKDLGREGLSSADKAVQSIAGSPVAAGIATLLAARLGYKGLRGVGRAALRGRKAAPQSLIGGAIAKIKKLVS